MLKIILPIAFVLAVFSLSLATLLIAYTSQQTMVVIDHSLTRHVDQYLLERAVKSIVTRELEVQNLWLKISGFGLLTLSCIMLIIIVKLRSVFSGSEKTK
ncbi:hypothetical protein [Reinekea sp. G2M2-21]|uniref:hypothetical protein n=1 Tax=Reinekea sp. G2M2-21 TaxID=2788942 RepID=UPI0018AAB7B5|nr:hypothetical protein [Reinekea sp. G2M2-21]